MKSRKLKNYQILANFPKRAFYRLVYVMNRFQWIFIKSPYFSEITDFNEIKEITDFSDSNGISKENLLPFGVLIAKIMHFRENYQISMKSRK